MDRSISQFIALKALVESAKADPANVGWYVMKSYRLGEGECSMDEVFEPPPKPAPTLRLFGGEATP